MPVWHGEICGGDVGCACKKEACCQVHAQGTGVMWVLIRAGYKVRTFIKRPALLKYAGYDMEFCLAWDVFCEDVRAPAKRKHARQVHAEGSGVMWFLYELATGCANSSNALFIEVGRL